MGKYGYLLRALEPNDARRMLEWLQTETVVRYMQVRGDNMTLDDTLSFVENAKDESVNVHRAITAADQKYYGTISLKNIDHSKGDAEYAIALHPDAIGTGAAYDASKEMMQTAFQELGLKSVYLNVMSENQRAIRFYEKFGFHYENSTSTTINGSPAILRWYRIYPTDM